MDQDLEEIGEGCKRMFQTDVLLHLEWFIPNANADFVVLSLHKASIHEFFILYYFTLYT